MTTDELSPSERYAQFRRTREHPVLKDFRALYAFPLDEFQMDALRALGVPARLVGTPAWHDADARPRPRLRCFSAQMEHIPFDVLLKTKESVGTLLTGSTKRRWRMPTLGWAVGAPRKREAEGAPVSSPGTQPGDAPGR